VLEQVHSNRPAILIVGPSWVGDMVMMQSLCKVLRQRHPDCVIDVVAPAWTGPLLARIPEVRRAIFLDVSHGQLALRKRWSLGKSLRGAAYDRAIILPRSFKSAIVPLAARARVRTGFRGEMRYGLLNDIRHLDKQALPRTVDRFISLGLEPGESLPATLPEPVLDPDRDNALAVLARAGRERPQGPVLALCPGAEYGPAKRWPPAHFAAVARTMHGRGWEVWILGSRHDGEMAAEIQRDSGNVCLDLSGKTSLVDALDLLSLADAAVSNDSGLMHVAAAAGTRVIAVYGSSDPDHTPPLSARADIVRLGLECSPCMKRVCPLGHTRCLVDLGPERVLSLLA
jgi:heptosyltransferase-2